MSCCYDPVKAWRRGSSPPVFSLPAGSGYRALELPCGQCLGCRLEFSRQWAVRCMHEARVHEASCFLTLTYDDEHVPGDLSLRPRDLELFWKRLRKSLGVKVRYYCCGEYGDINGRPHYHACVFGHSPTDQRFWRKGSGDYNIYTSAHIDSVWQLGACYVGALTFESAGYVARYVLKKVGSDGAQRDIVDVESGEVVHRHHEFSRMSRKPGIGALWFQRYANDCFPHDRVMMRGVASSVPRYYDKLLEKVNPLYLAEVKSRRLQKAVLQEMKLLDESLPENRYGDLRRLKVHEKVKRAQIGLLKRS